MNQVAPQSRQLPRKMTPRGMSEDGRKLVAVHIGDFHASREPSMIKTVLGSCIAVCLYCPMTRTGGMNHILLPGGENRFGFDDSSRWGINAMELLINAILKLGGYRLRLQAKVFGGGHVLPGISVENSPGHKNVEFVEQFLGVERIPIVARDTGGTVSRQVILLTDTFEVYVKKHASSVVGEVIAQEQSYKQRLEKQVAKTGDVELFDL